LHRQNFFLHGISGNEFVGKNGLFLTNPVSTVNRLGLNGGVPPRVKNKDVFGGGQVEPYPTRFE
jgi:hypothetical protein